MESEARHRRQFARGWGPRASAERLRPCRAEDMEIRGEASASVRAGWGPSASARKVTMSADYIMVGGFLGAGKTTAMLRLAEHLTSQGPARRSHHQRSESRPRGHLHRHGQGLPGRGDHRRLLLLPFQFVDRRRRAPDARRAAGRLPRRACRQLHRPAGDRAVSVAAPLRRRLSRRAAERARRSGAARRGFSGSSPAGAFRPRFSTSTRNNWKRPTSSSSTRATS